MRIDGRARIYLLQHDVNKRLGDTLALKLPSHHGLIQPPRVDLPLGETCVRRCTELLEELATDCRAQVLLDKAREFGHILSKR